MEDSTIEVELDRCMGAWVVAHCECVNVMPLCALLLYYMSMCRPVLAHIAFISFIRVFIPFIRTRCVLPPRYSGLIGSSGTVRLRAHDHDLYTAAAVVRGEPLGAGW